MLCCFRATATCHNSEKHEFNYLPENAEGEGVSQVIRLQVEAQTKLDYTARQ